jgi:hypothetical protein
MKITLDFGITSADARKIAESLDYAAEVELLGKEQDSARYASELLMEIADKLDKGAK